MKLSIALFAAANADLVADCKALNGFVNTCWAPYATFASANATAPGYDEDQPFEQTNSEGECGFQYENNQSLVNSTCQINNRVAGATFAAGNAAFVEISSGSLIGLAFSGEVSILQTWTETFNNEAAFNTALLQHIEDATNTENFTGSFSWDEPAVDCFTGRLDQFSVQCTPNADGNASQNFAIMITNQEADSVNTYAVANFDSSSFALTLNTPCNSVSSLGDYDITLTDTFSCTFTVDIRNVASELLYFQADVQGVVDFFAVSG